MAGSGKEKLKNEDKTAKKNPQAEGPTIKSCKKRDQEKEQEGAEAEAETVPQVEAKEGSNSKRQKANN